MTVAKKNFKLNTEVTPAAAIMEQTESRPRRGGKPKSNKRNVTLLIDRDLIENAKTVAVLRKTNLNQLVTKYLERLVKDNEKNIKKYNEIFGNMGDDEE